MDKDNAADIVAPTSVAALAATLDHDAAPAERDALPPLWHWIFFRPAVKQSLLAADGHPRKGGFLPDLDLPRRMWAGGRLRFAAPVIIGARITRESRILDVREKHGRTGRLGFVTVAHRIACEGTLAIEEEHDIVYREAVTSTFAPTAAPTAAPDDEAWHRTLIPDATLLFRYSALTFNAHRIHYDAPYVTQIEGYPGLVVHGPLIATLLMDLLKRHMPDANVRAFSFKALRPCFAGNALHLCGKPSADGKLIDLWSKDHEGWLGMRAQATLD